MYQKSQGHIKSSPLTDTKNTLLCGGSYKYTSVKNSLTSSSLLPLSNRISDEVAQKHYSFQGKRQHDLTSTTWKDDTFLSKHFSGLNVKNKYLDSSEKHEDKRVEKITKKASSEESHEFRAVKKRKVYKGCARKHFVADDFRDADFIIDEALSVGQEPQMFDFVQQQQQQQQKRMAMTKAECEDFTFGAAFSMRSKTKLGSVGRAQGMAFGAAEPFACISAPMYAPECRELEMSQMPVYQFESLHLAEAEALEFYSIDDDADLISQKRQQELMNIKMFLLNAVSTSLMYSPNYRNPDDPFRRFLTKVIENVLSTDPEFVLKVALYTRQELHIRSTSNYLLAYSAYRGPCRPFLKKYFSAVVRLPSDWLEVAEIYVTFKDEQIGPRSLPAVLRKVMVSSFSQFDEYQLAKYNKKKKKNKSGSSEANDIKKPFTLKQLVRTLHINSPVEHVMCLLGKKYPNDPESFRRCGLPGNWNSEKAGKRMKLPVPETWETKVSTEGNKPYVWESLIENSKLPYMAMLRNLKNLIMSGISKKYHTKVLQNIINKNAVLNSRQFPLRFYAAYRTLEEIEKTLSKQYDNKYNSRRLPAWKEKQKELMLEKIENIDPIVLSKYKIAVNKALEISTLNNVDPISGKTLVICDLMGTFQEGTPNVNEKAYHNCILFGLICLKACEDCEMKAICNSDEIKTVELEDVPLLENMSRIASLCRLSTDVTNTESELVVALNNILMQYLHPHTLLKKKLNNIIFLLSSSIQGQYLKESMNNFLHKYRQLVNPDLFYVEINAQSSYESVQNFEDTVHLNNVYLCGFSDQILKFVAEKGNGRQLSYVETIDEKYELGKVKEDGVKTYSFNNACDIKNTVTPYDIALKWKPVRIFISSTFKDMHGERDLLLRYVFPELKMRASSICVKIIEIDLRWGINEEYSASKKCAEFCLREAQNSDIFIGILGERYGTIYKFEPPDDPEFEWVKKYPSGSSITELEMEAGALQHLTTSRKSLSFFYIRNNDFMSNVPRVWIPSFEAEDANAKNKLIALKDRIRSSGVHLYDGYPCRWGGVAGEKPFVAGLDMFGKRVLDDLWQTVKESYSDDQRMDEISAEYQSQQSQIELYSYYIGEQNTPLNWLIKEIKCKDGIFVITGPSGCGKSAFMVKLLKKTGDHVIPFFIGATSRSTELSFVLTCIANFISKVYPSFILRKEMKQYVINQFHDILVEGAKAAGENLLLYIDGLDQLDSSAQTLDWLPCIVPPGVKIICTASDSSTAYKILCKRAQNGFSVHFAQLNNLNVPDRKTLIKHLLSEHGKSLDESPFNNQMVQFITKVDCGLPLYIHLTCDYLKLFATYENLMNTIQNFPSTLQQLVEHVIIQIEKQHGKNTVQKALTLLSIVKEGLEESELHLLLSIAMSTTMKNKEISFEDLVHSVTQFHFDDFLPPIDYRSLLHVIRIFMLRQKRDRFMKLSSGTILNVLKNSYVNKDYDAEVKHFHRLLAAYYMAVCDPKLDGNWTGRSSLALRSLPFHLYNGLCYQKLTQILCSLQYIQVMFQMHADDDLLTHYMLLVDMYDNMSLIKSPSEETPDLARLKDYYKFVTSNCHILLRYPQTTKQQAVNESKESWVHKSVTSKASIVEHVAKSSTLDCRLRTQNVLKTVTCVDLHRNKSIVATGNEDGYLKVVDLHTGKVICSLKGHTSAVTSVCFVGNDRICTSSSDNSLCVWSIIDYFLVAVLKGHKRYISCCIPDSSGNFILSSSWDCSVRLWSAQNGNEISVLSDFSCPVNCIAHHPDLQMFACGLWNGSVEIWNSISLKRESVLLGHAASVKFLTYSTDGLNIISSSIMSEVFIWSSMEGLKIGSLKGHVQQVNSIHSFLRNSYFISASDDCTLKVWSNQQMKPAHILEKSKFCPIHFMEIIQTNVLAVAFQNGSIWLFDLVDGHVIQDFENLPEKISCFSVQCGVSHEFPLSGETFSTLLICGTSSGKIMALNSVNEAHITFGNLNSSVTFLVHTRFIIFAGTANGDIGLLSISTLDKEPSIIYGAHEGSVTALSITVLKKTGFGLSASTDMTMKLWEITYDEEMTVSLQRSFAVGHKDFVTSCFLLSVKNDAEFTKVEFISGSADNNVAFWQDNEPTMLEGLQASIVKVYSLGNYVFGCSQDGGVAMWTKNGSLITRIMSIQEKTSALAFDLHHDALDENEISVDFACVNTDGSISVKKPFQRSQLCTLEGHSRAVTSCCVNEEGVIISCSPDKTINMWKIPMELPNRISYHDSMIAGVLILSSGDVLLSADINGNLMLWTITRYFGSYKMNYSSHRKFVEGFINLIAPLNRNRFVCAVTYITKDQPKYLLAIISVQNVPCDGHVQYVMKDECSQYVSSEVKCVDFFEPTDTLVVGLKSGYIILFTPEIQHGVQLANDWILKMKISPDGPNLCVVEPTGAVNQYAFLELLNPKQTTFKPKHSFPMTANEKESPVWATAIYADNQGLFYIGDSKGYLRIVSHKVLQSKQVHTDTITGICFDGSFIITSSLDKTVKIWTVLKLRQVGQFHASVPIISLAVHKGQQQKDNSSLIAIGSTVGTVELLRWWAE